MDRDQGSAWSANLGLYKMEDKNKAPWPGVRIPPHVDDQHDTTRRADAPAEMQLRSLLTLAKANQRRCGQVRGHAQPSMWHAARYAATAHCTQPSAVTTQPSGSQEAPASYVHFVPIVTLSSYCRLASLYVDPIVLTNKLVIAIATNLQTNKQTKGQTQNLSNV